jgi:hypothetical protein
MEHMKCKQPPTATSRFFALRFINATPSFIHGGYNALTLEIYDDIHVLTIPGFIWFKFPAPAPAARFSHTCELIGGSQVMTIGGLTNPQSKQNIYYDFTIPDPYVQGIGIFDATAVVWKSQYDVDAPPYPSPKPVKYWYSEG